MLLLFVVVGVVGWPPPRYRGTALTHNTPTAHTPTTHNTHTTPTTHPRSYEDANTRYINIGPVNKVINMLVQWLADPGSDAVKRWVCSVCGGCGVRGGGGGGSGSPTLGATRSSGVCCVCAVCVRGGTRGREEKRRREPCVFCPEFRPPRSKKTRTHNAQRRPGSAPRAPPSLAPTHPPTHATNRPLSRNAPHHHTPHPHPTHTHTHHHTPHPHPTPTHTPTPPPP